MAKVHCKGELFLIYWHVLFGVLITFDSRAVACKLLGIIYQNDMDSSNGNSIVIDIGNYKLFRLQTKFVKNTANDRSMAVVQYNIDLGTQHQTHNLKW